MVPVQEVDPAEPISPYGESKRMIEWMLQSYHRAYGIRYVAFRYFNACGADAMTRHGQEEGATHIIARLLESIRDDQEFTLMGTDYDTQDGTCIRDYLHVTDIANAHVRALSDDVDSGVYNLGSGQGISNQEIIAAVSEVLQVNPRVRVAARRSGDPAMLTASSDKFRLASGWQPEYALSDIITTAWKWYNR
jgi:UDP-glucose 4-epimerase